MEMKLQSFEDVYIIVASAAPGFIIIYIRSLFVTGRIPNVKEGIFYYFLTSSIYYSFIYPIYLIINMDHPVLLAMIFFLFPCVVGVILGILHQKQIIRRIFHRVGLNPIHSSPSSWDYIFGRISGYHWIILTTTDNLKIYGLFGADSFASSEQVNRDLYIEQLTDENFQLFPRKHGLWIKESAIRCIEFIPD